MREMKGHGTQNAETYDKILIQLAYRKGLGKWHVANTGYNPGHCI